MANLTISLDTRSKKPTKQVRLRISHNSESIIFPTGIYVPDSVFTGDIENPIRSIVYHDQREQLLNIIYNYYTCVRTLTHEGILDSIRVDKLAELALTPDIAKRKAKDSFNLYMEEYIKTRDCPSTVESYRYVHRILKDFAATKKMRTISFEDITYAFLEDADRWLKITGRGDNTRHIFFSYIRAVIRNAIKRDEYVGKNPFDKFSIQTPDNGEIEVIETKNLRKFLSLDLSSQDGVATLEMARDIFLISFYLCGINLKDIFMLKNENVSNGSVCFIREKTKKKHKTPARIPIEPELQVLIDRYKGDDYLFQFAEVYKNYKTFQRFINERLGRMSTFSGESINFKKCRATWATIAGELEIQDSVIDRSLAHKPRTDLGRSYEKFAWQRTQAANRKVIDYVMEGVIPNSVQTQRYIKRGWK